MPPRAVAALGLGQLVNWGVLYYAFAVLLEPVRAELEVAPWVVTGAFSLALLVSAVLAPAVGRWSDRGGGGAAIVTGTLGAALLLVAWALVSGVVALYVVWAGLGVCMATALYEPAFAVVTRAHAAPDTRLRALATVTLYGGLASTVFLPLTALLVAQVGWRVAAGLLAIALIGSAALSAYAVGSLPSDGGRPAPRDGAARPPAGPALAGLTVALGLASLASASFIANLIPSLGERGVSAGTAAGLGGVFGVMQLPGRALLVSRRLSLSGPALLAVSLALQAGGLVMVAATAGTASIAAGVMTFATGAGLTTLARPHLVQALVAIEHAGVVNGRLARAQLLTRALGPVAVSALAARSSHSAVLVALAVLLTAAAVLAAGPRRAGAAAVRPSGTAAV
ncbi:MAG: MFS transporter [Vicinamibacterales bacterium]